MNVVGIDVYTWNAQNYIPIPPNVIIPQILWWLSEEVYTLDTKNQTTKQLLE